ncbi:MAG TPA: hypothetical protein VGA21_01345 [Cyclobacteriaceae bacterium]
MSEEPKNDKKFMRVISLFLLFFSGLVFISAAISSTPSAVITNVICGLLLAIISAIFYYGYKRVA